MLRSFHRVEYVPCEINLCGGLCWVSEARAATLAQAHLGVWKTQDMMKV
jgi:hypothetical protein